MRNAASLVALGCIVFVGCANAPDSLNLPVSSSTGPSCEAGQELICHVPPGNPANEHDLCVGAAAVKAHLDHGDRVGSCNPTCRPATSCPAGQNCGTADDGCGGTVACGTCTAPDTCAGGGTANQCGHATPTCSLYGQICQSTADCCNGVTCIAAGGTPCAPGQTGCTCHTAIQ